MTPLKLSPERLKLLANRLHAEGIKRKDRPHIEPTADRDTPAPLTAAQRQMWFLESGNNATESPYVILGGARVLGALDVERFCAAVQAVVERHEALRTRFVELNGIPAQVVVPEQPARIEVLAVENASAEEFIACRLEALARERFDLGSGPLLRVEILRFEDDVHAVLFAMHHIVSDLWSVGILLEELGVIYAASPRTDGDILAPLTIHFADYARWQQSTDWPSRAEDLDFWRRALAGAPDELGLMTDYVPAGDPTYAGASRTITVGSRLTERVRALAASSGTTPFSVLAAAYAVFLARISGTTDVVVGTPVSGRAMPELDPVIGCFINTVVLRVDVSENPTFTQLVRNCASTVVDAMEHQQTPFDEVVQAVGSSAALRSPVFHAMFSFQDAPPQTRRFANLVIEPLPISLQATKFDLHLDVIDLGDEMIGTFSYSTELFSAERGCCFAAAFEQVLASLVTDPAQRTLDAPLLDAGTRARVLAFGTGGPPIEPVAAGLHSEFERWAKETPDAVAVTTRGRSVTYGELDARATRLARRLVDAGVAPDAVVAVGLQDGIDFTTAMLAAWKGGAAYTPLDSRWPPARLDFVLKDTGASVLIADETFAAGVAVTQLDIADDGTEPVSALPSARPDRDAYIIYTSGSTGTPKGVRVTHHNLLSYLRQMAPRLLVGGRGTRYLQLQVPTTDLPQTAIVGALTTGGELHILTHDEATDADFVAAYIAERGIDWAKLVPSHLDALAAVVGEERLWPSRALVIGGEEPTAASVRAFCSASNAGHLLNEYGPTETTIGVTVAELTSDSVSDGRIPLGVPVPGVHVYVLDSRGGLVPPGVVGEMFVGGSQVARGYLRRPDLNAERFVPDLFTPGSARMYRTGDRVSWTTSGDLVFYGRVDDQVKIRGYRVEPREIEATLTASPFVGRAIVVVRTDSGGVNSLAAYVTPGTAGRPRPEQLLEELARTLPSHLVPSALTVLDAMPLTANGKIDRGALPEPTWVSDGPSVPPRTVAEQTLADLFAAVLGMTPDSVGIDDSFFELGGDSIKAIHLVSRARDTGVALSTRDVLTHPTVRELASSAVVATGATTHDSGLGDVDLLPLAHLMRASEIDDLSFSHRVVLPLPKGVRLDHLTDALSALLEHHDALRARLVDTAGAPSGFRIEAFAPADQIEIAEVDIRDLTDDELRQRLKDATGAAIRSLNPRAGRNLVATVLDPGPDKHPLLVLVAHHLVVDAVSWMILLGDLRLAYEAAEEGRAIELSPTGTSVRTWAETLRDAAGDPAVIAQWPRWRAILGIPTQAIPVRCSGVADVVEQRTIRRRLRSEGLLRLTQMHGLDLADLLVAAWGLAADDLRAATGGAPVGLLAEVETHGRHDVLHETVDLTRTVGWLTAAFPVRLTGRGPATGPSSNEPLRAMLSSASVVRSLHPHALTYGMLRVFGGLPAGEEVPEPQLIHNHLGHLALGRSDGAWEPTTKYAEELEDSALGLTARRSRALSVDTHVEDQPDGPYLVARVRWTEAMATANADALIRAWCDIVDTADAQAEAGWPEGVSTPADPAIERVPRDRPAPLSFSQTNSVHQPVGVNHQHHNNLIATTLTAREPGTTLDLDLLQRSLDTIMERHEALRTRIQRASDGTWSQHVAPGARWPLRRIDLSGLGPGEQTVAVQQLIEAEQRTPFDLASAGPVRTTVLRLATDTWVLLTVLHHIAIDPWGYSVLQHELAELYAAAHEKRVPRLPELTRQVIDIATWQQRELMRGTFDPALAYWRALLDPPPAKLRYSVPPEVCVPPVAGYTRGFSIDEELTARVERAARASGATTFMFLLSAYHVLVSVFSRSDDVTVSFPIAGRDRLQSQLLIGYFINEVLVRTRMSADATFADVLGQVRRGTLDAHEFQEVPLRALHGGGHGDVDPFRLMFNLVNYEPFSLALHGMRAAPVRDSREGLDDVMIPEIITAMKPYNVDLYLAMHERGGVLNGIWLFSPDVVDPHVMGAMVRAWPRLLDALVRDFTSPLSEVADVLWADLASPAVSGPA